MSANPARTWPPAVPAGVRAVGVATGSFTHADLAGAGAEVVLDSLAAFPAWFRWRQPANQVPRQGVRSVGLGRLAESSSCRSAVV